MRHSRVLLGAITAGIVLVSTVTAAACATSSGPSTSYTLSASAPVASAARKHHPKLPPDWPGYHGGGAHRGVAKMPNAGTLSVLRNVTLDGAVYGSPIAVGGTIVAATENDSVYGLTRSGSVKWHVNLGTPSPASQRPCGDIDPLGITGSPVYDPATGNVYVVAETGTGAVKHTLVAINLKRGKVKWRRSMDFPGRDATAMQQRGALALDHGRVWVTFGGLAGDCGDYIGRLIGVPEKGKGKVVRYDVPSGREAGMWQPSGPAVDTQGHLLVSVGNGESTSGAYDHSDSVLELSPKAQLLDYFAPASWASDNAGDVDLGSVGPALVGKRWIVQGGKSDTVYVLRQGHLGGIGGQVSASQICQVFGGAAVQGSTVYLPCTDGVRAVSVDGTGHLHVLWHFAPGDSGSPVVGGGRVWIIDQGNGRLYAADPRTGAVAGQVDVGTTSRFATPALYGRLAIVPTMTGVTFVRTS